MKKNICVFCGSSSGNDVAFSSAAKVFALEIVKNNMNLVYGGAHVGLMGTLADAVLAKGHEVIGVIPKSMMIKEIAHDGLTKLHVVGSMHERKQLMYDLSDYFVALPGGLGTLDELFEIITWKQIGTHAKPIGLWNLNGYYDQLIGFIDKAKNLGFIPQTLEKLILVEADPKNLLKRLTAEQD
jgi:uncharacterized protein (TIGR00730 family)